MNMDTLKGMIEAATGKGQESTARAEQFREQIDNVKEGISGISDTVDEDIRQQIKSGLDTGIAEAKGDIETQKGEMENSLQEMQAASDQIDSKISANTDALNRIESLSGNKYSKGVSDTKSALQKNSDLGMAAKQSGQKAFEGYSKSMEDALSGL